MRGKLRVIWCQAMEESNFGIRKSLRTLLVHRIETRIIEVISMVKQRQCQCQQTLRQLASHLTERLLEHVKLIITGTSNQF